MCVSASFFEQWITVFRFDFVCLKLLYFPGIELTEHLPCVHSELKGLI